MTVATAASGNRAPFDFANTVFTAFFSQLSLMAIFHSVLHQHFVNQDQENRFMLSICRDADAFVWVGEEQE